MSFSQSRTQDAVNRSRQSASNARKAAANATGGKRASLLKDAKDYEKEANRLVKLYRKEGVR